MDNTERIESGAAAAPGAPQNSILLATLETLVAPILSQGSTPPEGAAFVNEVDALEKALLQSVPQREIPGEDKCGSNDPILAPFCAALDLATATANHLFQTAETTASGEYRTAISTWSLAVVTYKAALQTGNAELQLAVNTAKESYRSKFNQDSQSRNLALFFAMKSEVAAAISTYEAIAASAGSVLAAAAGNLIAAFATYSSTVASSEVERLGGIALAQSNFWQSVESIRDQV